MSIFGTILSRLGLDRDRNETRRNRVPPANPKPHFVPPPKPSQTATPPQSPGKMHPPAAASEQSATPNTVVDVTGKLEAMASANPEKLNWKTSIVDLLKLLELDSSLPARKELAVELGCPPDKMEDSAQMNMWLHNTVLRRLAQNGGNIPSELLS